MSYFLFGLARRTRRAAGNRHLVPRTVVQTIRRHPSSIPFSLPSRAIPYGPSSRGTTDRDPRSRDPPPIANHRAGLTLTEVSRGIDFDGTLVFFLFFSLHRALPLFWLSAIPHDSFAPLFPFLLSFTL